MSFTDCVNWVLAREIRDNTGWSPHDPTDRGGRTRWGISQRTFPNVNLDLLSREGAIDLYLEHYWTPVRGADLGPALDLVVFDTSVPCGAPRAVKMLQQVVGAKPDGILGVRTLATLGKFSRQRVIEEYLELRMRFHVVDGMKNPEQPLEGWLNRVLLLAMESGRRLQEFSDQAIRR